MCLGPYIIAMAADKLWVRSNSLAPGMSLSKQFDVGQNPVFEVKWEVMETLLLLHDRIEISGITVRDG